ncbi:MAG TPA: hypothetical protein DCE52_02290 [Rhodobacteraceae bacterium]|nr:hypothetical protein [Paracoccaceae bacterium]
MPSKAKTSHSMWEGYDLARERTSLGKSQIAFASILGLSHRMYCYYERGEKKIPRSVELAVRHVARQSLNDEPIDISKDSFEGTLTDFQNTRIEMLADAAEKAAHSSSDPLVKKILQQSSEELSFLLSKFE